ncbi:MAG TPA: hypothetical protein VIM64_22640 [Puia sp.]
MKYLLFFVLTAYIIRGCTSRSDKAIKKFNDINDSLKAANNSVIEINNYGLIYRTIQQLDRDADAQIVDHADNLYKAASAASSYITRLKAQLMEADSIGDKTQPAARLLLRTPASDSLRTMLLDIYTASHKCFVGQDSIAQLDKVLLDIVDLRNQTDWTSQYFENSPTVAAETILSRFEMECAGAASLSFLTVLHQLGRKP